MTDHPAGAVVVVQDSAASAGGAPAVSMTMPVAQTAPATVTERRTLAHGRMIDFHSQLKWPGLPGTLWMIDNCYDAQSPRE